MYNKVYIEITNICNMSCSFCHGHKREKRQMTEDEFAFILNKLTEHTKYIYYHLMGEPLTHPQLPEFIKTAGEHGFKSIITTNGTLLKKRKNDILSAGVHKVNISLHSFENGSDAQFSDYLCGLADFAEAASEKGIITVFRLWNRGFDDERSKTAFLLLKELISGEWAENTRGIRIRDKIHIEWGERFEWPDENASFKDKKCFCYGLKDQFGILVDGTVVPCCLDSEGAISLGNIFCDTLESILGSERARKIADGFIHGIAHENLCKRCGYAQRFSR